MMSKKPAAKSQMLVFFYILVFGIIIQTTFASTAKETIKKNISFAPGGYLSLSNSNGNVQISTWAQEEVEIIAHKEVKASDRETAEKMLEELLIDIRENEGEILIKTEYPRHSSSGGTFFGWLFGNQNKSFSVRYEIKVPSKTDLNIETTNGNVTVEGVEGRIKLESTNGQISGREITGQTRCKTTNGSINVEFSEILGEDKMIFKSTNGSIKLYLPEDFGADVDLKTTNGRISSDFTLNGRQSRTRFSGTIQNSSHQLSCTTTNGNIGLYKR